MDNITDNDNIDKIKSGISDLFKKGGLFKTLLFWFLILAFIPVIIDRYAHVSLNFLFPIIIIVILLAYLVAKRITAPFERFLKEVKDNNKYQAWLRNAHFTLVDRMGGDQDISSLCSNIITFLSEFINARTGLMYLNEDNMLRLFGSYSSTPGKSNHIEKYKLGEGPVGKAALEKTIIIQKDNSEYYESGSSDSGEMAPGNIIAIPIIFYDGSVKAVIELKTSTELHDKVRDFFDNISKSIAIALHTTKSREQMNELLEKTLLQAKELQKHQEELKQKNDELEEQKVGLEKQKEDMKLKNQALEQARMLLEDRASEIETASQYKSQFLANMSHELRTPLNSIILLSQLLSDNKDQNLTEEQVEYARSVQTSGYDLLKLINEILDLSKIEAGKIDLDIEDVPLIDIANTIKRNFRPVIEKKNITFSFSIDENLPETIESDRQRIEQILKNLLSNAFKFTSHGKVELRISRPEKKTDLSLSGLNHVQCISFAVSDTGIGIPDEKLKIIFEAFEQADNTTSRKYGGTGLGLSISRDLAMILGGEIQAVSDVGKGSTFTLYLPDFLRNKNENKKDIEEIFENGEYLFNTEREGENEKTGEDIEFIQDDRDKITKSDNSILIIGDDVKVAEILRDFSQSRGFKTVVAKNGEIGLHFTELYNPSAILMDIPGINGWSVISRLKGNIETRHIPVYFVSAIDRSREALKMGAVDYVMKPVSKENLEKLLIKIEQFIAKTIKNLLVIEDNPVTRKIIEKLFNYTGVQIVNVPTGNEAIEKLANENYDCVILDLSLPDMTGFEILTHIKKNQPWFASPIVVYTGKKLSAHERAILDEYTESIIVKGANSPAKLLDEVSLYLHLAESELPEEKRKMLHLIHDKELIFKGKKVLVTDDDMRNVFLLTNILEQKGMKVIIAKNGLEALSCLEKNHDIDLVIMDIMMPEMDGYTAIKKIRKNKYFANLPIISLTAKAMKGDRAKCIEAGASDYLSKPFEKERLFSLLRAWLY